MRCVSDDEEAAIKPPAPDAVGPIDRSISVERGHMDPRPIEIEYETVPTGHARTMRQRASKRQLFADSPTTHGKNPRRPRSSTMCRAWSSRQGAGNAAAFCFACLLGARGCMSLSVPNPFQRRCVLVLLLSAVYTPQHALLPHTAPTPSTWGEQKHMRRRVASTHMLRLTHLGPLVLLVAVAVVQTTAFLLPTTTPLRPIVLVVCACLVPPALGRLRATGDDAPPSLRWDYGDRRRLAAAAAQRLMPTLT